MQWLTDLLKHIGVSKRVAFAIFVASSGTLAVDFRSDLIGEPLPGLFRALLILASLYSAGLLFAGLTMWVFEKRNDVAKSFRRRSLNDDELDLLVMIGRSGEKHFDLEWDTRELSGPGKLQIRELAHILETKGLLCISFDERKVWLTDVGRARALDAMRSREVEAGGT